MEVITPNKNNFTEIYKPGDVFYQPSEDMYFILTEYENQWQLISLDGNDGETYSKYEELQESVKPWVTMCLTDYTRYSKSDYQLILHKKGAD